MSKNAAAKIAGAGERRSSLADPGFRANAASRIGGGINAAQAGSLIFGREKSKASRRKSLASSRTSSSTVNPEKSSSTSFRGSMGSMIIYGKQAMSIDEATSIEVAEKNEVRAW